MAREKKLGNERALLALLMLESGQFPYLERVAEMFNTSRTSVRRALDSLARTEGDASNRYKERVKNVKTKYGSNKGAPIVLNNEVASIIKSAIDLNIGLTQDEISSIFGISRGAIYRGLKRLEEFENSQRDLSAIDKSPERMVQAGKVVHAANIALSQISIPNDLSESDRDLLVSVLETVSSLDEKLSQFHDANQFSVLKANEFGEDIQAAMPLWKRAWETFVLKSAEGAGLSTGKAAVFTVGFVAGTLFAQSAR